MKKSLLAASLAASASAISASSSSPSSYCNFNFENEVKKDDENSEAKKSSLTEKFAPRFDGLKFIETLITAHR